jgi:hypothetical protein
VHGNIKALHRVRHLTAGEPCAFHHLNPHHRPSSLLGPTRHRRPVDCWQRRTPRRSHGTTLGIVSSTFLTIDRLADRCS